MMSLVPGTIFMCMWRVINTKSNFFEPRSRMKKYVKILLINIMKKRLIKGKCKGMLLEN